MSNARMIIEHQKDQGRYRIQIFVPDDVVPYAVMKTRLLSGRSCGIHAIEFARELLEKEAYWYRCPTWDLDYGININTNTTPSGGNGDTS